MLAQLVFYQREATKRKEVVLMANAVVGAKAETLNDLLDEYKSSMTPPLKGDKRKEDAELAAKMDNFEEYARAPDKPLRRLD